MKNIWQGSPRSLGKPKADPKKAPQQGAQEVETKLDGKKDAREEVSAVRSLHLCEILAPSWAWRISHH